jgi:hypothetical protein
MIGRCRRLAISSKPMSANMLRVPVKIALSAA